jgi:Tol biopolymer transport system component/tRNA A-37 threonylcarbamoyl transferase component Bud32
MLSLLGKGGMGEVWRARDPRLGRDVAIKISAQQFSDRFDREARSIAALNHPNICTLHDVGPNYLVMELIDGATLAERIAEGPIPLEEVLRIAKQIAAALEAAHEKGIVHRDLKPANIKLRPDGSVKVLDFGLATTAVHSGELTHDSPTMLSAVGMIVGTAGYMAPEQARGGLVDKRADIWAFGVVLYEMCTGRRLFDGATVSDCLASILKDQPDLTPAPASVRLLLAACLEKDPRQRLRDIGDFARLVDNDNAAAAPRITQSGIARWAVWIAAAIAAISVAAVIVVVLQSRGAAIQQTYRFRLSPPEGGSADTFALSPDGRTIAFAARVNGKQQLWLHGLDSLDAQPVPSTEGASFPFWSPDSGYIGFFADGKLKRISSTGGPAQTICDAADGRGATWNAGDTILFSADSGQTPIRRVAASGGTPIDVTSHGIRGIRHPFFLPDGHHFFYLARGASAETSGIFLRSLDRNDDRRILPDISSVVFARPSAAARAGEIVFVRDGTLMAVPFDEARGQLAGEARPIAEHVGLGIFGSYAPVSVSSTGVLVYVTGLQGGTVQLAWFDRKDHLLSAIGQRGGDLSPALSPDGNLLAFERRAGGAVDIWIRDLKRGSEARLTTAAASSNLPQWSPGGEDIAFGRRTENGFGLFQKHSGGSGEEELLLRSSVRASPYQWSRDGKFLLYGQIDPKTGADLWLLPMRGSAAERKPIAFLRTAANEQQGQISPDGKWIAFASDQSGRLEVYVRPFPANDNQWTVSVAGGQQPRWRSDGKEIFFLSADGKMMAVPVKTVTAGKANFEAGIPAPLFDAGTVPGYDVAADGQRFLIAFTGGVGGASSPPFTVVTNWEAGLRK